jgi:hypothetical protein
MYIGSERRCGMLFSVGLVAFILRRAPPCRDVDGSPISNDHAAKGAAAKGRVVCGVVVPTTTAGAPVAAKVAARAA